MVSLHSFLQTRKVGIVYLLALVTFFFSPLFARAATLDVSPANGSVAVGQTITVRVNVSTNQAMNGVSGTLSFPSDLLSADYVSKSGSVLTLWVQDPVISNAAGNVTWSGVVPNPGFTGTGQTISIQLRAKKIGTANLSLASSEVLANDGNGTNILTGTSGGVITITEAVALPPTPSTPTKAPPTQAPTIEVPVVVKAPINIKLEDVA
jgi:hypothetical protein